ncbi:MAG: carbohydrate porin [Lentisphaeria bacterium]|nr:carbohydrate porin [Lentisphaeria bacterium]
MFKKYLLPGVLAFGVYAQDAETKSQEDRIAELEKRIATLEESENSETRKNIDRLFAGLELNLSGTGILQATSGADDDYADSGDEADASYSFDFEITKTFEDGLGTIYIDLEMGNGDGIDGEVPTFSGVNGDATGDESLDASEIWYENTIDKFRFKIGKVDPTGDFDANTIANDETTQFLNGGFINNLAIDFPDNGAAAVVFYEEEEFYIGAGIFDGDGDFDDVFSKIFWITEVGYTVESFNIRAYYWENNSDHDALDGSSTTDENSGFGLSFDAEVSETASVFGRYGMQDEDVAPVEHAISGGVQFSELAKQGDALGFAAGLAIIGDKFEDFGDGSGKPDDAKDEMTFEVYYRYPVSDNIEITPDIQYIMNPAGEGDADDLFVFGIRCQVNF